MLIRITEMTYELLVRSKALGDVVFRTLVKSNFVNSDSGKARLYVLNITDNSRHEDV